MLSKSKQTEKMKEALIECYNSLYNFMYKNSLVNDFVQHKEKINLVQISTMQCLFLALKDNIIEKTKFGVQSKLYSNMIESNFSLIGQKEADNTFTVGTYNFENLPNFVNELRNQLAHGQYQIDDDIQKIQMTINNHDLMLSIDDLTTYVASFLKIHLEYGENYANRVYGKVKLRWYKKSLKTKGEIKRFIKQIEFQKLSISSNEKVPIEVKELYREYENNMENDNKDALKILKEQASKMGCKLQIELVPLENYINIDDFANCLAATPSFLKLSLKQQAEIIIREGENHIDPKGNLDIPNKYLENLYLINYLEEIQNSNDKTERINLLKQVYNMNLKSSNLSLLLIQMFQACFGDTYDHELGKLEDEDSFFDYSSLDVSMLENITFTNLVPYKKEDLKNSASCANTNFNKINKGLNLLKENQSNTKDLSTLKEKVAEKEEQLVQARKKLELKKCKLDITANLTKGSFSYNEALIKHMRDSIAHGTYELRTRLKERCNSIIFRDYDNGNLNFEMDINADQLVFFLNRNLFKVIDYLHQIEDLQTTKKSL